MRSLPFSVPLFTPAMEARTLLAHVTRGIALHITSPATLPFVRHRSDLVYTLGLSSSCDWYKVITPSSGKLSTPQLSTLFHWIGQYWQRPLEELDVNSIRLAVNSIPQYQVDTMFHNLCTRFNYFLTTKSERLNAMNLTPNSVPPDVLGRLEMSLASLEHSLLMADPQMPSHLKSIHSLLISYPESVQLLDDMEIARLIDGAELLTKTEIVKAAAAKTSKARAAKVAASDL